MADVVYLIHWRYSATTDDAEPCTASTIGTSSVTYDPDGPDPFIPFEDLTEAIVQSWVESDPNVDIESMQESLLAQIQEEAEPTHETMRGDELPWNEDE